MKTTIRQIIKVKNKKIIIGKEILIGHDIINQDLVFGNWKQIKSGNWYRGPVCVYVSKDSCFHYITSGKNKIILHYGEMIISQTKLKRGCINAFTYTNETIFESLSVFPGDLDKYETS